MMISYFRLRRLPFKGGLGALKRPSDNILESVKPAARWKFPQRKQPGP